MEKLDKDLQNRVWQRVQSREKLEMPPLGQENLRPLILTVQENRQVYQNLSHQMPGKDGERIRRLQQECQKCITCKVMLSAVGLLKEKLYKKQQRYG